MSIDADKIVRAIPNEEVQQMLAKYPSDMRVLSIGVDSGGYDCCIGTPSIEVEEGVLIIGCVQKM